MNIINLIPPSVFSFCALVGTYCLILAYQKRYEIEKVLANGVHTFGTVSDIWEDPSGKRGKAPVVDFVYPNGSYRHVSTTYTIPCNYHVGQRVEIWYKFYKSNQIAALADDKPGNLPNVLLKWGIVLCLLSYPLIIGRMMDLI